MITTRLNEVRDHAADCIPDQIGIRQRAFRWPAAGLNCNRNLLVNHMCDFSPDVPAPTPAVERSQTRMPDGATARTAAGRRTSDRVRAGQNTILTSGSGVLNSAPTSGKTLLGQ